MIRQSSSETLAKYISIHNFGVYTGTYYDTEDIPLLTAVYYFIVIHSTVMLNTGGQDSSRAGSTPSIPSLVQPAIWGK